MRDTLTALQSRVAAAGRPLTVSLYGSAAVGQTIRRAVSDTATLRDLVRFEAFISSSQFRTANELHGLRWETPEWLVAEPTDVVLNTSESSRRAITDALSALGLAGRTVEVFGALGKPAVADSSEEHPILRFPGRAGYEYLPYLPELGPIAEAGTLEHAYKEFRVLMPKAIHPYSKGDACGQCSLRGICDGFHADYADIFGFDEAVAQHLDRPVYDPCYYAGEQVKVVEAQEFDWALPEGHPLRERKTAKTAAA
jgi:hypothetical protein